MCGCEKKGNIIAQAQTDADTYNNPETDEEVGHKEQLSEDFIDNKPTEEIKVGITLKLDPSMSDDRVVYVNQSVTGLILFKLHLIAVEGLGQLESLETVVFGNIAKLSDLSFLAETPRLKRLFTNFIDESIDWSFIEQLPDLEVLHIETYRKPTVSIDLKNNKRLEYIGFKSGALESFPTLLNIPDSLRYINLENNKIVSLPLDFETFSHLTIFMDMNPFKKDITTPDNVTVEFSERVLEQKYISPLDLSPARREGKWEWISGVD
jgi:hypothetical protein